MELKDTNFGMILENPEMAKLVADDVSAIDHIPERNLDVLLGISNIPRLLAFAATAPWTDNVVSTTFFAFEAMKRGKNGPKYLEALRSMFTDVQLAHIFAGIFNYQRHEEGKEVLKNSLASLFGK